MAIADSRSVSGRVYPATEDSAPIWQHARYPLGVRALNRVGRVLDACGVRWPRLDPERLMAAARRRAGLSDFGDDLFREGLGRLVESFEANPAVHEFGRHFFREYCVGILVNRLKMTDEWKRHPEIDDVPVTRPLVITGLPRSGTTLLHRLMSEDPVGRMMLFWEAFEPSPAPRPETYRSDPRIRRARKAIALINRLAPRIPAAHHFAAEEPEEDNTLFAHEFRAGFIGFMFDVPDYTRWLNAQDRVPGYRSMRRQLQLLSRHIRGAYWILKSPAHIYGLDALLTVFPDANVVHTHRDPARVIPSVASLSAGFRSLVADPLDLRRLGTEFAEAMALGLSQATQARVSADPARFFDVRYETLVADPIGTVREVCQHFGYDFTPSYEARTRRYLAENPQHKHGVHHYSLDDFGLDAAAVARQFGDYRDWLEEHVPQMV